MALGECGVAVVGLLRVFVRQLQEQQVGELLQVVAITHAVVAQGVAEVPDFLDEGRRCSCIHSHKLIFHAPDTRDQVAKAR
jgi:hypothetical protein